jgi:hypothetical protein
MTADRWAAIWSRVFNLGQRDMDAEAARTVMRLKFKRSDIARINRLSALARDGDLSEEERHELEGYLTIGDILTILHSKARMVLKRDAAGESWTSDR